jgi:FtsH-binding integral membrane protein
MSDTVTVEDVSRNYWPKGIAAKVLTGLSGVLAIIVALKAAAYEPADGNMLISNQDHMFRILAFAALTVWTTLAIGIRRRGAGAMITLGFAVFVEMILVPLKHEGMSTVASANLGIVIAYCAMHLYWRGLVQKRLAK